MKILIVSGKFGMGHASAAEALAQELRVRPGVERVIVLDLHEYANPNTAGLFYAMFGLMAKRGSGFYNRIYRQTEDSRHSMTRGQEAFYRKTIQRMIDEIEPDLVISVLPLASRLFSQYKTDTGSLLPLLTCITDVTCHSEWLHARTDLFLVASGSVRDGLIRKGIPASRILACGIPVRAEFRRAHGVGGFPQTGSLSHDAAAAQTAAIAHADAASQVPEIAHAVSNAKSAGQKKRLLVMGGGLGMIPSDLSFYRQLGRMKDVETIVVAGRNESMRKKIASSDCGVTVLGYVEGISELMRSADLMLTKPGGITLFEALHAGTPLLTFSPFLEQEKRNAAFLAREGLGYVLPGKPETGLKEIEALLKDDAGLAECRARMDAFLSTLSPIPELSRYTGLFQASRRKRRVS